MELGKGQKIPLNENFLTIKFQRPDSALEIDTAAFLTQSNGKVAGDEDFVFYGNARHNSGQPPTTTTIRLILIFRGFPATSKKFR